ncbi:MAG: hypothetical protein IJU48_01000 [Synergistaceae bacterium]|nr:hypothetical protein [Synergistaceae bacterium]
MSSTKEFFNLVSKDANVKMELGEASLKALIALAKEKGLQDDAKKTLEAVTMKVAEAHGFDLHAPDELSDEELDAVAGGDKGPCDSCISGDCGNCQHVGVEN